ncbi:MAG: bifunctional DNA-formamidopyrimidine glycosylase/DNA-(apurinic or apyrimidinic site) lyase [Oceanospirillales bacterium]|jgi:formamidopyrimidine-DNA glycosylase|nr:MAG: bifunctional DNA-formamidopyrimidine glycosylase/DNA-(apurinic or apyrimidinic site) lyase [Oceanospirillales bacterium]
MPELPEVETTCRGIAPYTEAQTITAMTIRQPSLRWPIPTELSELLPGQCVDRVTRRAKYIQLEMDKGELLIHLGMSGSLRVMPLGSPVGKHDHVDIELSNGYLIRFTDPRRFGAILWQAKNTQHALLQALGPEPLSEAFDSDYLYRCCLGRKQPIKQRIMDNHVVVGVGNIYASEALFAAGIDPRRAAGRISKERLARLVVEIKRILDYAITRGGTTLRDFVGGDGKPGYFQQELFVYGRKGEPCKTCGHQLKEVRLGQRSSVYCPQCQR